MDTCTFQLAAFRAFAESDSVSGLVQSLVEQLNNCSEATQFSLHIVLHSGLTFEAGDRNLCGTRCKLEAMEFFTGELVYSGNLQGDEIARVVQDVVMKRITETVRFHRHTSDVVSRILGITFHDVRNTLGSISGIAQLMEMDASGKPELLESIKDVLSIIGKFDESATATMRLLRGQDLTYRHESFSLTDMVTLILKRSSRVYQLAGISIESSVQPGIQCIGDESCTKEVVMELLTNAATALEGSGGTIYTTITATNQMVEISVGQSGSPVSSEVQEYIFIPFFTTKEKGRGMGLTRIARYMKDWGGTILLQPLPDQPVRFVVTLPITLP